MSQKKKLAVIIGSIVVIALLVAIGLLVSARGQDAKMQEHLDLGAQYLDELDYERAFAEYMAVLSIDPKCVDAYLGIVDAYVGMGDYENALLKAQEGYDETGDERLKQKVEEVKLLMEPVPTATPVPIEVQTPEPTVDAETDWLTQGVPSANILSISDYKIGGVIFSNVTPQTMRDSFGNDANFSYGVYDNEIDSNWEVATLSGGSGDSWWRIQSELRSHYHSVEMVGENARIGFGDINFGDNFNRVMEKLGFTEEQAEWVRERIDHTGKDYDEYVNECNAWICGQGGEQILFDNSTFTYTSGGSMVYGLVMIEYYEGQETNVTFGFDENSILVECRFAENLW